MDLSRISTTINSQIEVVNFLTYESREEIIAEIYAGLSSAQKYVPSRFFYDDSGSMLFEKITSLPEYYPTRTEKSILRHIAHEITGASGYLDIIELGSGDCTKISILLDAVPEKYIDKIRYIPVDVSETAILKSADLLSLNYPEMNIQGLLADFMKHLKVLPGSDNRLICFFGSTLGNLTRKQAVGFLKDLKILMHPGDRFLLGLDMVKDITILEDAYNDKQGITAAFNKNILRVINQHAGTDFKPELFEHIAFYNSAKARIEMHLRAIRDMVVSGSMLPREIVLKRGETIHTENSHKYTEQDIHEFADLTGLVVEHIFTDSDRWFSLAKFKCVD